jgi:hypothetical protein
LKAEFLQAALVSDPFLRVGAAAPPDGPHGECHITVATSVSKGLMTVELRRLLRTEPVSRAAVPLPRDFDPMRRHVTAVTFAKWNVSGITMDGEALSPRGVSMIAVRRRAPLHVAPTTGHHEVNWRD